MRTLIAVTSLQGSSAHARDCIASAPTYLFPYLIRFASCSSRVLAKAPMGRVDYLPTLQIRRSLM